MDYTSDPMWTKTLPTPKWIGNVSDTDTAETIQEGESGQAGWADDSPAGDRSAGTKWHYDLLMDILDESPTTPPEVLAEVHWEETGGDGNQGKGPDAAGGKQNFQCWDKGCSKCELKNYITLRCNQWVEEQVKFLSRDPGILQPDWMLDPTPKAEEREAGDACTPPKVTEQNHSLAWHTAWSLFPDPEDAEPLGHFEATDWADICVVDAVRQTEKMETSNGNLRWDSRPADQPTNHRPEQLEELKGQQTMGAGPDSVLFGVSQTLYTVPDQSQTSL